MTASKFFPKTLLILLLTAPFFIACQDKETSPKESEDTVQEASLEQKKQMLDNVVPSQNNGAEAGLNPPHGEPGHRCDIAVGAPLNSPAGNTQNQIQMQPVQNTAESVKVADGLNPPHGQPGHRCDIAVGAPL